MPDLSFPNITPDLYITLDFLDACFGAKMTPQSDGSFQLRCRACGGTGRLYRTCISCGGTGKSQDKTKRGLFIFRQPPCDTCKGTGKTADILCRGCAGNGYKVILPEDAVPGLIYSNTLHEVHIPVGIDDGLMLAIRDGKASPDGTPVTLCIGIRVREHPVFRRDGCDIRIDLPVSSTVCENGGKVTAPCIDGKAELVIPKGTQYGTVFKLVGKGVRKIVGNTRGDEYVRIVPESTAL